MTRYFLPSLLLLAMGGCMPTRSYSVAVRNELDQPITVWLMKSGPPAESLWLSPEQLAIAQNPRNDRIAGRAVAPGKIAETGTLSGKFPQGTDAILRVYVGQHDLNELISISRPDDRTRIDVPLDAGRSDILIQQRQGKLMAAPAPSKL